MTGVLSNDEDLCDLVRGIFKRLRSFARIDIGCCFGVAIMETIVEVEDGCEDGGDRDSEELVTLESLVRDSGSSS